MKNFNQITITLNEYNHNLSGIGLIEYSFFEQESRLTIKANNVLVNELSGSRAVVAFNEISGNKRYLAKFSIEDLESIAAICCGATVVEMKQKTRNCHAVFARWLVWDYIVKYFYPNEFKSLQKIADLYGREHASVIHGINTLKERQFGWRATASKKFWKKVNSK